MGDVLDFMLNIIDDEKKFSNHELLLELLAWVHPSKKQKTAYKQLIEDVIAELEKDLRL